MRTHSGDFLTFLSLKIPSSFNLIMLEKRLRLSSCDPVLLNLLEPRYLSSAPILHRDSPRSVLLHDLSVFRHDAFLLGYLITALRSHQILRLSDDAIGELGPTYRRSFTELAYPANRRDSLSAPFTDSVAESPSTVPVPQSCAIHSINLI